MAMSWTPSYQFDRPSPATSAPISTAMNSDPISGGLKESSSGAAPRVARQQQHRSDEERDLDAKENSTA